MKFLKLILLVLLYIALNSMALSQQTVAGRISLRNLDGFEPFESFSGGGGWTSQHGLGFITPELVSIYEVVKTSQPTPLSSRDESGGSGNFQLRVYFLNVNDGKCVKTLVLTTDSQLSAVLPTRMGRFIVRTGDLLRLYSADFKEIRTLRLPLSPETTREWWQIAVSPSGLRLFVGHHREFGPDQPPRDLLEIRDAETFQIQQYLHGSRLNTWSAGDSFIIVANPEGGFRQGLMTFDGIWRELPHLQDLSCPVSYRAADSNRVIAIGCQGLQVLLQDGKQVFARTSGRSELYTAVSDSGTWLAAEVSHKKSSWESFVDSKPTRIEVFDLPETHQLGTVSLHGKQAFFCISEKGTLVVVQDSEMMVFQYTGTRTK